MSSSSLAQYSMMGLNCFHRASPFCSQVPTPGSWRDTPNTFRSHRTHICCFLCYSTQLLTCSKTGFHRHLQIMFWELLSSEWFRSHIKQPNSCLAASWNGQWKAELETKAWNYFRKILFVSVSDDLALLSLNEVLATRMESFHCPGEAHTLS